MRKIICCPSSGSTLYESIPSQSLALWLAVHGAHIEPVALSGGALAFRWRDGSGSPQLPHTRGTAAHTSLHLLGPRRAERSQTKPKYTALWLLLTCGRIAVVNKPNPALAFYFALEKSTGRLAWSLYTSACPLSFRPARAGAAGWRTSVGWGPCAPGKVTGIFRKGRNHNAKGRLKSGQWPTSAWAKAEKGSKLFPNFSRWLGTERVAVSRILP